MPAPNYSAPLRAFWKIHRWIFRQTGGRFGTRFAGKKVLLLTTTGRKSGLRRENTIYYFEDLGRYVVIASNVGRDRHPLWYLNLQEDPAASVLVDQKNLRVTASDAAGEERDRLWQAAVALDSAYQEYQERTDRTIPVVVLTPISSPSK